MSTNTSESEANISPIISVALRGEQYSINLAQLNTLHVDMEKYDDAHGIAGMALSLIFSTMPDRDTTTRNTPTIEELAFKHATLMQTMGLSFEPVAGKRATMYSENEVLPDSQMRLNIQNRKQFLQFLQQINKDHVDSFGLDQSISSLSTTLTNQLADHYDLRQPTDEALELVVSLESITAEYKRLGLEEATTQLDDYALHIRKKDLREYILLNRSGLMQKPREGFGPADWHRDISLPNYNKRWEAAFYILKTINNNPNARGIFEKLHIHLTHCIEHARTTIDQTNIPHQKAELIQILQQAEETLNNFEV